MTKPTADLCDEYGDQVRVLAPALRDYGGVPAFSGPVTTLRVLDDNALVRAVLETPGDGRVLVIDGQASMRSALVGGNLGKLAEKNGWAGIVVWGTVRDSTELGACRIGLRALATQPRKSAKAGAGERDLEVVVAGVTVRPGDWLVADADGVIVASTRLG